MKHILRNLTEDIVISKLDILMERMSCCRCDLCRLDIASYALNRLPSKYVATTQGELLSKIALIDNDFTIRVTTEITKAINVIKEHPRHEFVASDTLPEFPEEVIEPDGSMLPPGAEANFTPTEKLE